MHYDTGPRVCIKCGTLKLSSLFIRGSRVCDVCMQLGKPEACSNPERKPFVCHVCERALMYDGTTCGPCILFLATGKADRINRLYNEVRPEVPAGNIYSSERYKSERAKWLAAMTWLQEEGLRQHLKKGNPKDSNQGFEDNEGEGWKGGAGA